jgi:hypothetical protein
VLSEESKTIKSGKGPFLKKGEDKDINKKNKNNVLEINSKSSFIFFLFRISSSFSGINPSQGNR